VFASTILGDRGFIEYVKKTPAKDKKVRKKLIS
jgi:hypothetical protein